MQGRFAALWALSVGVALITGVGVERFVFSAASGEGGAGPKILYWVAPMDPNFRKDGPGKSPMGMDLVPVYEGQEPSGDPAEVKLSAAEINAIGVRTAVARVEPIAERIETVGFVGYNEHGSSHIHTRTEGWIERMRIRAIGDRVRRGDLLYELYAPEITIASSELMRATKRQNAPEIAIATRKLKNFGVSDRQIREMARAAEPAQHIRVYAPQDGVVIGLTSADGMYLKPETRAMTITDLSSVWLLVDVFERDIARLSKRMRAEARFEALPGRVFRGAVDYVYPELDPKTRTLRVRLRFDNAHGLLKPNMFGRVSLTPAQTRTGVTVPSEAVIRTGKAERVILKTGDGTYKPRLITIGLRDGFGAGGRTEILQGLRPGEEVVASAQFLIDSESALSAGITRFAPTDETPAAGKGELLSFDAQTRIARIRHDAIAALDWPALETAFALRADVALGRAKIGDVVKFELARGADGRLSIVALGLDDGIDAVGAGTVHAVTKEGKLSLSHDPIPALGWPAMKMDLPVKGFDPKTAPIGEKVELSLAKTEDGLYAVVGVKRVGEPDKAETPKRDTAKPESAKTETPKPESAKPAPPSAPPITVEGVVQSITPDARTAKIKHGPIKEIGMPGMVMDFRVAEGVNLADLPRDVPLTLTLERPDGITMVLSGFARKDPPPAAPTLKVMGVVEAVDADARTATVKHGPIKEIGMPGMTMAFQIAPEVDPKSLPLGRETAFELRKNADFSLTIVGVGVGVGAGLGSEAAQ